MAGVQCSTPLKIVKHKGGKPLKSGEKTIVLNAFNKFKRIYKFKFKQIRFPHTSKRTRHRSVLTEDACVTNIMRQWRKDT